MSTHLADKSLEQEARLGGWALRRRRDFAEPGVEPHYAPDRTCRIDHIALDLSIDPEARTLVGEARIRCQPLPGRAGRYRFDLDEVTVDAVTDGAGAPLPWRHADGSLDVDPADTIVVRWHGSPRRGLYFVGPGPAAPTRPPEAWTQCQDEDAHFVFPCHDHPGVKHPWSIRLRAPEGYGQLSNGRRVGEGWEVPEPMPAYLFTAVVMKMDVHVDEADGLPVHYAVPAGSDADEVRRAFHKTPAMIRFLSSRYGPYAWPRYDQVIVHDFVFGGMENLACTTLVDITLVDPRAALDNDMDSLVVHELGHQWFGDLLTCQDWSQGWLNEGWATYTEYLWFAEDRGQDEASWHQWENLGNYLGEEGGRYRRPIVSYLFREPIDVFDRHLYEKGNLVLHTLRAELGEEAFWNGARLYLSRHAHQTVHTRHFQRAMEDATGRTLDRFFDQWIFSPGHPVLEVSIAHGDGLLTVAVKQTQDGEGVPKAFHFPLSLDVGGVTRVLRVDARERSFVLPCAEAPAYVSVDSGFKLLSDLTIKAPRSLLIAALRQDPCVIGRVRAAKALAAEGSPEAVAALAQALLSDGFYGVKAEIAALLGARGEVAALTAALGDPNPKARRAVVAALGTIRRPDAEAALVALGEDPSILVAGEIARALGRLRSPAARARCEALLSQGSWMEILRARALEGLGLTRDAAVLDPLTAWTAEDKPVRARAAAIAALGRLGDEVEAVRTAVVERLIQLAEDPNFRVQVAAINALGVVRDSRAMPVLTRVHQSAGDGRCRRLAWESMANVREGRGSDDALAKLRGELEGLVEDNRKLRGRVEKIEQR